MDRRMKLIIYGIILNCVFATCTWSGDFSLQKLVQEKANPVIHPELQREVAGKAKGENAIVWVFFTDKEIFTSKSYHSACRKVESTLSDKVRWRRSKVLKGGLVDFRDLPVHGEYIETVLATGARFRMTTRWFNGISIEVPVEQLDLIVLLPFVREIRLVYKSKRMPVQSQSIPRIRSKGDSSQLDYGPSYHQLQQI